MRYKALLEELLMFLHESAVYHRDLEDVRSVLEEAQGVVRRLQARLQWAAREYAIALVGLSDVGKSTLVNALSRSQDFRTAAI